MKTKLKVLALFSLFTCFTLQSNCQELYSYYIDGTSQWQDYAVNVHPSYGACPGPFATTYSHFKYSIDGDTLIDGFKYHKMMVHRIDSTKCDGGTLSSSSEENRFYAGISEDSTRKIFINYGVNGRKLLWDFGASDSSICENLASMDTVWLGNQPRKVYNCDCGGITRYVIEGIGANTGISNNASCEIGHHGGTVTICYQKQGFSVSLETDFPCGLTPTNIQETKMIRSKPLITPNPNNGFFKINIQEQNANVQIFDSMGRIVFTSLIKRNELIHLDNIKNGTYIIQVTNDKGINYSKIIVDN